MEMKQWVTQDKPTIQGKIDALSKYVGDVLEKNKEHVMEIEELNATISLLEKEVYEKSG